MRLSNPRLWLWVGAIWLALGIFNAITQAAEGGGAAYRAGYLFGAIVPGVLILYFGWYRRRKN